MLNQERIQNLVESYSVQEMFAAMVRTRPLNLVQGLVPSVWQRQFNEFDGREVVSDLTLYDNLWRSFIFSRPVYLDDKYGLSFAALIEFLPMVGNRKPTIQTTLPQEFVYPGDTLFVLARNEDLIVSQLMDLGKKWRASEVYVYDAQAREFDAELQQRLYYKLRNCLWGEKDDDQHDAVVISFWWD